MPSCLTKALCAIAVLMFCLGKPGQCHPRPTQEARSEPEADQAPALKRPGLLAPPGPRCRDDDTHLLVRAVCRESLQNSSGGLPDAVTPVLHTLQLPIQTCPGMGYLASSSSPSGIK